MHSQGFSGSPHFKTCRRLCTWLGTQEFLKIVNTQTKSLVNPTSPWQDAFDLWCWCSQQWMENCNLTAWMLQPCSETFYRDVGPLTECPWVQSISAITTFCNQIQLLQKFVWPSSFCILEPLLSFASVGPWLNCYWTHSPISYFLLFQNKLFGLAVVPGCVCVEEYLNSLFVTVTEYHRVGNLCKSFPAFTTGGWQVALVIPSWWRRLERPTERAASIWQTNWLCIGPTLGMPHLRTHSWMCSPFLKTKLSWHGLVTSLMPHLILDSPLNSAMLSFGRGIHSTGRLCCMIKFLDADRIWLFAKAHSNWLIE